MLFTFLQRCKERGRKCVCVCVLGRFSRLEREFEASGKQLFARFPITLTEVRSKLH